MNSPFGNPYQDPDDREQHADEAEEWRERFAEADRQRAGVVESTGRNVA